MDVTELYTVDVTELYTVVLMLQRVIDCGMLL